jgi:hypothetical protein
MRSPGVRTQASVGRIGPSASLRLASSEESDHLWMIFSMAQLNLATGR